MCLQPEGLTPIHCVGHYLFHGDIRQARAILKLLLKSGADVNAQDLEVLTLYGR